MYPFHERSDEFSHFNPKPWEQLQNPLSNSKTLGATPKPWEQQPLLWLSLSLKKDNLRISREKNDQILGQIPGYALKLNKLL